MEALIVSQDYNMQKPLLLLSHLVKLKNYILACERFLNYSFPPSVESFLMFFVVGGEVSPVSCLVFLVTQCKFDCAKGGGEAQRVARQQNWDRLVSRTTKIVAFSRRFVYTPKLLTCSVTSHFITIKFNKLWGASTLL